MNNNQEKMKKLLESIDGGRPGDQVRGTEKISNTDGYSSATHRLVGGESEEKFLGEPYIREEEFNEDEIVNPVVRELVKAIRLRGIIPAGNGQMGDREIESLFNNMVTKAQRLRKRNPEEHARAEVLSMVQPIQNSSITNERELGAGHGDATQRGTPPWMVPGGGNDDDGRGGRKTSFQLAGGDEDDGGNPFNDPLDEEEIDEYGADVANDMATPQPQVAQRKSYGDVRGGMSPAARNMFAQRELAKMDRPQQQQSQEPVFSSKDYSDVNVLEAKLAEAFKAFEDVVGDPYSENNVLPKGNKRPGKDVPKPKKAKRQPEPNELAEDDSLTIDRDKDGNVTKWKEEHDWHKANPKKNAGGKAANLAGQAMQDTKHLPKKKEKPFRDAAATGNPRDFANEASYAKKGTGNGKDSSPPNINISAVPGAKEHTVSHWTGKKHTPLSKHMSFNDALKAAHGHSKRMGVPLGRDLRGGSHEIGEAKGKSENRELWDRIKARGTTRGIDKERYTDMSGEGLEGPFSMKNGKVLYYDPKEGNYYDRDTDMYVSYDDYQGMNEGDPDIPPHVHDAMKAKDRQKFVDQHNRGEAGRKRGEAEQAAVRFYANHPVKNDQGENPFTEDSSRAGKLKALKAKFEGISCKLKELKGQKALKEAPINQTVAPVNGQVAPGQQAAPAAGQQAVAPAAPAAPATPGTTPAPAAAAPNATPVPAGSPQAANLAVPEIVAGLNATLKPDAKALLKKTVSQMK